MATTKGTNGSDTIVGTIENDVTWAKEGNDYVTGDIGDDLAGLSTGNDTAYMGPDNDTVYAGEGNDTVGGDGGDDLIWLGKGDDLAFGGVGDDTIGGGQGRDSIYGGEGSDVIYGGIGSQDSSIFDGNRSDYTIYKHSDGSIRVDDKHSDDEDIHYGIEYLEFDNATIDLSEMFPKDNDVVWEGTVPSELLNNNGFMKFGSGNTGDNYVGTTDTDEGVSDMHKLHTRQGADYEAENINGVFHWDVREGTQIGNPARAEFNISTAFLTGENADGRTFGDDIGGRILIDGDLSSAENFHMWEAQFAGPGNTPFADSPFTGGFGDEDGFDVNQWANSLNINFNTILNTVDGDPNTPGHQAYTNGPGEISFISQTYDKATGEILTSTKSIIHIGAYDDMI